MRAYETYFQEAARLLGEALAGQGEQIETAARKIYGTLARGGMLYTFGTGHAHLLAEEIFYRAGGLARVCPMLDERLMLHLSASESTEWERKPGIAREVFDRYPAREGDVLIVISNSGRNAAPVEMAALAREKGLYVIALTSLNHSRESTPRNDLGKRLFEVADLVLDNRGIPGDAILPRADGGAVGPTSTVVGAALLQGIVCRVEELARDGGAVDFFVSSNINGGDAVNERIIAAHRAAIRHL
ncbi:hypothetical protein FACS1894196_2050 [Clostridia bacterium]|nr:hypothetical protein FACS1894196_2050 [Clostridia bacterium]